jgi:hypothetical protein
MYASLLLAGGLQADLAWLLWAALGFFVLVVFTGWLASRRGTGGPDDGGHGHDGGVH